MYEDGCRPRFKHEINSQLTKICSALGNDPEWGPKETPGGHLMSRWESSGFITSFTAAHKVSLYETNDSILRLIILYL